MKLILEKALFLIFTMYLSFVCLIFKSKRLIFKELTRFHYIIITAPPIHHNSWPRGQEIHNFRRSTLPHYDFVLSSWAKYSGAGKKICRELMHVLHYSIVNRAPSPSAMNFAILEEFNAYCNHASSLTVWCKKVKIFLKYAFSLKGLVPPKSKTV